MLISVIIPAFNAERLMEEAIDSASAQSHREFELMLIDDGSSDRTPETLSRYEKAEECVGGYRPEFWPYDDLGLWSRIVDAREEVLVQPEYLVRYRIHGTTSTVAAARQSRLLLSGGLDRCWRNRQRGLPEPSTEEFIDERRRGHSTGASTSGVRTRRLILQSGDVPLRNRTQGTGSGRPDVIDASVADLRAVESPATASGPERVPVVPALM